MQTVPVATGWPNQFRLLLSSLAYVLMQRLRDIGLRGTGYAKAQVGTIRLTLLKIGAVIIRNTRRIKFFLSSAYPHQQLFCQVVARLDTAKTITHSIVLGSGGIARITRP